MLSSRNGVLSGCGYNSVSLKEGEKITQTLLNVANQAFSKLAWGFHVRQHLKALRAAAVERYCHPLASAEPRLGSAGTSSLPFQLPRGSLPFTCTGNQKENGRGRWLTVLPDFKKERASLFFLSKCTQRCLLFLENFKYSDAQTKLT